jgi:amino acid permease
VAPVALRSYRALTTLAFGRGGALASDVSIILFLAGACVGYSVIVGEVLEPYVERVPALEGLSAHGISAILVWGIMYPLSLLKSMHSLRYTSFAAFGAIVFLVVCIVIRGTEALAQEEDVGGRVVLFNWSSEVFSAIPIIAFAFSMHNQLMNIWAELADPAPAMIRRVMIWAVFLCTVLYMVVGAFGYLSFFEVTGRNILLHYDHDTLVDIAKIGYVVIICFSFPLMMFPTTLAFNCIWQDLMAPCTYYMRPRETVRRVLQVTALTATVFLLGMLVPDIAFVFGLSGATAGVLVMFIIPAACSLKIDAMHQNRPLNFSFIGRRHATEIFLLVAGVIFMVAGVIEVFVEQAHSTDD